MKRKFFSKPVFMLMLSLSIPLLLSACGSGPSNEELKTKIQELEQENKTLKGEIAFMKDTYAKEKTKELQNAFRAGSELSGTAINSNAASSSGAGDNSTSSASNALHGGANSVANAGSESSVAVPAVKFLDLEECPTSELVYDLAKVHVFDGMGDKFKPNQQITRAEFAEWLFKAYNALEPESKQIRFAPQVQQEFKDTPPSCPQYKYIQALANAGFSIGYEDQTFRPTKPLTREELLGIKIGVDVGKTLPPWRSQMEAVWKFSDSKEVDERFTGYVHQDFYVSGPHGSNIQRAFGKIGTFRPKQAVLRYEAAGTLWQMGQFGDTQNTNVAAVLKEHCT